MRCCDTIFNLNGSGTRKSHIRMTDAIKCSYSFSFAQAKDVVMTSIKKRQFGGGLVTAIVVIVISLWLGFKLIPIYMQDGKVTSILDSMRQEAEIGKKSNAELQKWLLSRLDFEKVTSVNPNNFAEVVKIERTVEGFILTVQYGTSAKLVSNISLIVDYKKTIKVP